MDHCGTPAYTRVLTWDGEAWNVVLPEWDYATTFGNDPTSQASALQAGDELLALLIEEAQEEGKALPSPHPAGWPGITDPPTVE